jgi:hypothetical protein
VFKEVKCDGTSLYWENLIKFKDYEGTIKDGNLDISPELLFELSYLEYEKFPFKHEIEKYALVYFFYISLILILLVLNCIDCYCPYSLI